MEATGFFTASEAARVAKVPRSTLDYWRTSHLIEPSRRAIRPRLYSFQDLRDLVVAEQLRRQGARGADIRAALGYVRSRDDKRLAQANFGVAKGQLVYVHEGSGEGPVAPHKKGQRVFEIDMGEVLRAMGVNGDNGVRSHPPNESRSTRRSAAELP